MTLYFYTLIYILLYFSFYYNFKLSLNISLKKFEIFTSIILIVISSFRWEVGGDWSTYLNIYDRSTINHISFQWSLIFELINFLSKKLLIGIWGVNLLVSVVLFYSFYKISKILKFDYLFILTILFSLIYFNILMGYVRQGLCLSILILSFCYILKNKKFISACLFLLAILTHMSVIIFLPLWIYFYRSQKLTIVILCISIFFAVIINYTFIFISFREFILKSYMISPGFNFRSIPLILNLLLFIFFYKKIFYEKSLTDSSLIYNSCLIIFLNLIVFFSGSFSAFVDRLNVFFTFYQIIIIGKLFIFVRKKLKYAYIHTATFVSFIYFFFTIAWFLYGDYSVYWLDYNFIFHP